MHSVSPELVLLYNASFKFCAPMRSVYNGGVCPLSNSECVVQYTRCLLFRLKLQVISCWIKALKLEEKLQVTCE